MDGVPPGDGRRRLEDRRDGQDRRAVLLLQADPAHAAGAAAVDAVGRASKAGASTSCRWTTSSPRSTTSATARPSSTGKCFHLVDPVGYRVGDVLDIFSTAAHAPKMNLFVNAALLGFIPKSVKKGLMALAPVRRIRNAVLKDLGLPEDMLTFVNYPTRFDMRETTQGAGGQRHRVPEPARLRVAVVGLLGAPPRPGAVHRPQPEGHGAAARSCSSPAARRASAWRPRTSSPRRARRRSSAGATRTSSTRRARKPKAKGYKFIAYPADIADMADCDRFIKQLLARPWQRRLPDQQRRAARSAARSKAATTAFTTSSARCSSTTSAACA